MKTRNALLCLLALPASLALAAEPYRCSLIDDAGGDAYKVDHSQYVDLVLDPAPMPVRIHIKSASKDLRFKACAKTKVDGSKFADWFETECREFASLDGKSFSVDAFLIGAYAGISPPVTPAYPMHATLTSVAAKIGLGTPERTFVIYADRKPQYEFFCYPEKGEKKP